MKQWNLAIEDDKGKVRKIPLDHEYETAEEASREAENIADEEYTETDVAWGVDEG